MSGLIHELLKPLSGLGIKPIVEAGAREIVIELKENEVKEALLRNIDERVRRYFDVKVVNGAIRIIVKLI